MTSAQLTWLAVGAASFVGAAITSMLLTPPAAAIGRSLGLLDAPNLDRKQHSAITPRSGGVAVFLAFYAVVAGGIAVGPTLFSALSRSLPGADPQAGAFLGNVGAVGGPVLAVLIGGLAMFGLGLADDRRALGPRTKLVIQIAIAIAVCLSGVSASAFLPPPFGVVLSVGWILVITNAFNLLDNSDGLSSGVAWVTALGFAAISLLSGEWLLTATWSALAGACFGFWRWNFWRGTPFLGDGGALLIGFLFGALSLRTTYYSPGVPTGLPVLTPLVLLAVPLFDTLSVIHIRWRAGRPIMEGDRNHFSHRLEAIGFTRRGAVVAHYILVLQMILAAWALRYLPAAPAVGLLGVVALQLVMLYQLEMRVKPGAETAD